MDSFLGELGREALTKVVELTMEHVWHGVFEPSKPNPEPRQPEDGALQAMDAFLRLVAQRDMDGFLDLCDPTWAQQDDTAALMDATLEAAPPISWAFQEVRVPADWRAGTRLPWVE